MLTTTTRAAELIHSGKKLLIAGDRDLLTSLPQGQWIGGTIPYFMSERGGCVTRDEVFVTELPKEIGEVRICRYRASDLMNLTKDAFKGGLSFIIVPASSEAHLEFARQAPDIPGIFGTPLVGWISGVHLGDLATARAATFDGTHGDASAAATPGSSHEEEAVVMHCSLPADKMATVHIVNLFTPGDGPTIMFDATGFSAGECTIGGKRQNLATYLTENGIDTKQPLVADYCGAMVNISFQAVDAAKGEVTFYAPVFSDVEYRIAKPVKDYVSEFQHRIPVNARHCAFSCNCILNFLYSELEGKKTGHIQGPITFGEIAYQLLNQTLVYVSIDAKRAAI